MPVNLFDHQILLVLVSNSLIYLNLTGYKVLRFFSVNLSGSGLEVDAFKRLS